MPGLIPGRNASESACQKHLVLEVEVLYMAEGKYFRHKTRVEKHYMVCYGDGNYRFAGLPGYVV